jgi:hypothetical protein
MSPYISFVMFARNDGYGHYGTARLQHSIDTLWQQLNDLRLDAEILLVEWNPPSGTVPLVNALSVPREAGSVSLRFVTVPAHFHKRYQGHAAKGMHVAAAFNVGLRRARGEFVLPKPSDVYFTDQILERIARRNLDKRRIYRVNRFDIDSSAVAYVGSDRHRFFEHCSAHVVQEHTPLDIADYFQIRKLHTNACGDFSLLSRELWCDVRGWYEGKSVASLDVDSLAVHAAAAGGATEEIWSDPCRVYKLIHGAITVHRVRQTFRPYERWIDSIAERTLSIRGLTKIRILLDFPRRTIKGLPGTHPSFERNFLRRAQQWALGTKPFHLNSVGWGLAGKSLPEIYANRAVWDQSVH